MSEQIKPGKKNSRRKAFILVITGTLILLAIPIFYVLYSLQRTNYDNSQDQDIIINEEQQIEETVSSYQSIALFGVDSRSNSLTSDTRSDTIMIASIDNQSKKVRLASIYRDTYVEVPNHGYTKINHAYAYGGYSLALSTLNVNFDLRIKQYVSVNFYAVTKVIDLLGGITLDITKEELKWLNGYIKENNRVNGTNAVALTFAGTQVVNGTQALAYARIRYTSGGDFKRAERQRIVVDQVLAKAKEADFVTLISIIHQMLPEISTNIPTSELIALGKDILSYQIVGSEGYPMNTTIQKIHGISYVLPKDFYAEVTSLHEYLYQETGYMASEAVRLRSEYIQSFMD